MSKNIKSFALLLLAFGSINQVLADNGKTLPGTMCKATNSDTNKIAYLWYGMARNESNSVVWVLCPVIRDEGSRTVQDAWLQVRSNTGVPLNCYFIYRNVNNSAGLFIGRSSPDGFVNSDLRIGSINTMPNSFYQNGIYSISCQLLPGDGIHSYFVLENE